MSEEKKLTDEEIVKALEICAIEVDIHDKDDCKECPYFMKKIDCVTGKRSEKDTLDLIKRQKAEIERLTEENTQFEKDVHDMSWIIKVHKYCVGVDHCQNSSAKEYKLQKRIEDLEAEIEDLSEANFKLKTLHDYSKGYKAGRRDGTYDTAKEILRMADEINKGGQNDLCELEVAIKERYGVGVDYEN